MKGTRSRLVANIGSEVQSVFFGLLNLNNFMEQCVLTCSVWLCCSLAFSDSAYMRRNFRTFNTFFGGGSASIWLERQTRGRGSIPTHTWLFLREVNVFDE